MRADSLTWSVNAFPSSHRYLYPVVFSEPLKKARPFARIHGGQTFSCAIAFFVAHSSNCLRCSKEAER